MGLGHSQQAMVEPGTSQLLPESRLRVGLVTCREVAKRGRLAVSRTGGCGNGQPTANRQRAVIGCQNGLIWVPSSLHVADQIAEAASCNSIGTLRAASGFIQGSTRVYRYPPEDTCSPV